MKLNFRPSTTADFSLVFNIKKDSLKPYIEQVWGWDELAQLEYLRNSFNPSQISIILTDEHPVGLLETYYLDDILIINNLLIVKNYQGRGIGTQILQNFISASKNNRIQLEVLKVNHRAQKLYAKLGFQKYGETDKKIKMEINPVTIAEGQTF